jgi:hypothetical protein
MDGLAGEQRACRWCEALGLARDGELFGSWTAYGDGGVIVESYTPGGADDDFWTESIRWQPTAAKLYRDMTAQELARFDTVWPALRAQVRAYFLRG